MNGCIRLRSGHLTTEYLAIDHNKLTHGDGGKSCEFNLAQLHDGYFTITSAHDEGGVGIRANGNALPPKEVHPQMQEGEFLFELGF